MGILYRTSNSVNSKTQVDIKSNFPIGDEPFSMAFTLKSGIQNRGLLFSWGPNVSGNSPEQIIVFFDFASDGNPLYIGWADDGDQEYCYRWDIQTIIKTVDIFNSISHDFLIIKSDTRSSTNTFSFDLYIDETKYTPDYTFQYPESPGYFQDKQSPFPTTLLNIGGDNSWGAEFDYYFGPDGYVKNIIIWDIALESNLDEYNRVLNELESTQPGTIFGDTSSGGGGGGSVFTATGAPLSLIPKNLIL